MSDMPPAANFAARGNSECVNHIVVPDHRISTLFVAQSALCTVFSRTGRLHGSWISNGRGLCSLTGLIIALSALTKTIAVI